MGPKTSSPKGMTMSQQLPPLSERKYKFASKLPTPLKSKNHAN
ncbi:unnamed protein product [Anisakis simplex]|uniref:Ovule protein n=1 Tax=Anisakis simplex TaxID=6269 RepID=A0A0M3J6G0_ANISI|nr:unnamed protein product [Anisakis simplex]